MKFIYHKINPFKINNLVVISASILYNHHFQPQDSFITPKGNPVSSLFYFLSSSPELLEATNVLSASQDLLAQKLYARD